MTISKTMNDMFNKQITNELKSSHDYLAMATNFVDMGLTVFARRFFAQSVEEREHALKIIKFVQDVGGKVNLGSIPEPSADYHSTSEALAAAVEAEQSVSRQINELIALAEKENDYASHGFLEWFVSEQVEEVASMLELQQWVKIAGEQNLLQVETRLAMKMGEKVPEE
jgi:ferritin